MMRHPSSPLVLAVVLLGWASSSVRAGELIVDLGKSRGITLVGTIRRWDADGNARAPVDPKAAIDRPRVDARAERAHDGRWVFRDLAEGRHDLVILVEGRVRVEGFGYPPVNEFDPFLARDAKPPDDETRDAIVKDIARSRHYENKVAPLSLAGDDKQVRLLVQLVRDQPTSFDAEFGAPAATIRHEIWQYSNQYGGWVKERRTKVLDRIILAKRELHQWTWVWKPELGGIAVGREPVTVSYELPANFDRRSDRGWFAD
jgi:hypothetical protein